MTSVAFYAVGHLCQRARSQLDYELGGLEVNSLAASSSAVRRSAAEPLLRCVEAASR